MPRWRADSYDGSVPVGTCIQQSLSISSRLSANAFVMNVAVSSSMSCLMFVHKRLKSMGRVMVLATGIALAQPAWSAEPLTVSIEQGGTVVPIKNNQATLQRAPFSIVSTLTGATSVSISASGSDSLIKAARKQRLGEPFINPAKAMTLEEKNSNELLYVVDDPQESYAYYFHDSPADSRFNEVTQSAGQMSGKVKVSKLQIGSDAVPVSAFPRQDLYVVFAITESGPGGKLKVTSSDYVRIHFAP